jgi:hypothetical protein
MTLRINFDQKLTQDEFTKIDPSTLPPELQSLYKEMQADYTRKATALADERKTYATERDRYEQQLRQYGAVEQEVNHWRQWYASLEGQDGADGGHPNGQPDGQGQGGEDDMTDPTVAKVIKLEQTIAKLQDQLSNVDSTLRTSTDRTGRILQYHTQLSDLLREHPETDRDKLVKHAVDNGFTDLKKAYDDLYRDDLIDAEVNRRLEEKLKETRAAGISQQGRQVILRPHTDAPKSFDEATQLILDERAKAGTLDLGGL